jgi:hypothetical protein
LSRPPSAILALFQQLPGASSQNAEYVYFFLMQEKYARNPKYFGGARAVSGREFLPHLRDTPRSLVEETRLEKKRGGRSPPPLHSIRR